jgi:phycocyanin-associated rod linker protein
LSNAEGYEAEINSYIDSVEYQKIFGESIVPYYRGFAAQRNQKTVGFNRMFQLYRGFASSDRSPNQTQARLTWEVGRNMASPIYTASTVQALGGTSGGCRGQLYRVTAMQGSAKFSPQLRRATTEYLVPYEQLSSRLQQINKGGGKVVSITTA